MKKVLIPLSVLCLLAALMAPMVGCAKEEEPATDTTVEEQMTTGTEMMDSGTGEMEQMGTDTETMGTGMETMGTDMATPPPAQ